MYFDAIAFIRENFPDKSAIPALLRAYGMSTPPTDEAVRKWHTRRAVPGAMVLLLACCLELDRGTAPNVAKYLRLA